MSELSYIVRPSEVFKLYLAEKMTVPDDAIQYGMLAMGLEIVTVIKTLEALPTTSVGARAETISVLHTLLRDVGLDLYAYEWYERLNEWRKPSFVPVAEQPHTDDAGAQLLQLSPSRASLLASALLAEQESSYTDVPDGSDQLMDQPSGESAEQADEEEPATSDE
jgi:hypothetical protein